MPPPGFAPMFHRAVPAPLLTAVFVDVDHESGSLDWETRSLQLQERTLKARLQRMSTAIASRMHSVTSASRQNSATGGGSDHQRPSPLGPPRRSANPAPASGEPRAAATVGAARGSHGDGAPAIGGLEALPEGEVLDLGMPAEQPTIVVEVSAALLPLAAAERPELDLVRLNRRAHAYAHGGFMGLAISLVSDPDWRGVLLHAEPGTSGLHARLGEERGGQGGAGGGQRADAQAAGQGLDVMAVAATATDGMVKKESLRLMTVLENSPVLCAYGLIRSGRGGVWWGEGGRIGVGARSGRRRGARLRAGAVVGWGGDLSCACVAVAARCGVGWWERAVTAARARTPGVHVQRNW